MHFPKVPAVVHSHILSHELLHPLESCTHSNTMRSVRPWQLRSLKSMDWTISSRFNKGTCVRMDLEWKMLSMQVRHWYDCIRCSSSERLYILVFLDLPAPWEAIPAAKEAFLQHRTGKICCFSPCIEQVAKTVNALNENEFVGKTLFCRHSGWQY